MHIKYIIGLLIIFLAFSNLSFSQTYTVTGIVISAQTKATLPGATIIVEKTKLGISTNSEGNYKLNINSGEIVLIVDFIGYSTIKDTVYINKDTTINYVLYPINIKIDEVTINQNASNENIKITQTGVVKLSSKEVSSLPVFFGEPDLIKTIRLTPGVQNTGELSSGLHVRGGTAGQNLIILDQMPLYNPSHLLGIFSAFNSDIIDNVTLSKGNIPANYGGRASSVLQINLKEGSKEEKSIRATIGLLSSKLTIELPFNKGKGSVIVGARRTFVGLFQNAAKPFLKSNTKFIDDTKYYFYDFNTKISYYLTKKDIIFFTLYNGKDSYSLNRDDIDFDNNMNWGNNAYALTWNHIFNNNFSVTNIIGTTNYFFNLSSYFETISFSLSSKIEDYFYQLNFNHFTKNNNLKFGINYTKHKLIPNDIKAQASDFYYGNYTELFSHEASVYINNKLNLTQKLSIMTGIRYNMFFHVGPYLFYKTDELTQKKDTIQYGNNEIIKKYQTPEFRISGAYTLTQSSSIKTSFSYNAQFIHLASIGSVSLPTDIWLPSTDFIKPEYIKQATLGYFRNFNDNTFETSAELFYRIMENQLKFKTDFLSSFDNTALSDNLTFGEGKSYGLEIFVKKKKGITTGWISYTLSKTELSFPELSNGKPFFAKYDQRHNLAIVITHQLNEKWKVSSLFVYNTGNALTIPKGRYIINSNVINHYTDINSYRMPPYHRLDVSANYIPNRNKSYQTEWNFGISNVYNRSNPYYIFFKIEGNIEDYYLKTEAKKVSLFPIMPYVSFSIKF